MYGNFLSHYKGGGANCKVLKYGTSTKRCRCNLNRDKCEFHKDFLIKNNISSDISYCEDEETSVNFLAEKIYRYANQLGKFNPSLSELSQTLCELLSTKSVRS